MQHLCRVPAEKPRTLTASAVTARLRAAGCVFAEEEARILLGEDAPPATRASMLEQRLLGFPLEHVVGWVEFCGTKFQIGPGVFVPRKRSEFLVACAAGLTRAGGVVLDLCCGCGALGAALASLVPGIRLHASDVSAEAAASARRNVAAAGGLVYEGDLFAPLPHRLRGRVGTLLCNAPYVPTPMLGTLPTEARVHEPRVSLDGGGDGLDVQRRVASQAAEWLAPGGHLFFEVGTGQERGSLELLQAAGLRPLSTSSEDHDATVVIGTMPG